MFDLIHNIDFVIAAICVLLVVYCSVGRKYSRISQSNQMFYRMVNTAMVQSIFDIIMNVAETYTSVFPPVVAGLTRTIFNFLTILLTYFAYAYVKAYSEETDISLSQRIMDICVWFLLIAYGICGILNIFTGIVSYIDENGVFHNGPIYISNYIVPLVLLIFILATAIKRRRNYTTDQFRAIVFFIILVLLGVVTEFLLSYQTLTTMFGVSLALLIVQLSLETPDYKKMSEAMEELKKSNMEVEKAREAAETANRAKSDFLARMSHEIRTPMNAVLGMNELVMKESEDASIREYARDAYRSANNLLNIINDILDFSKIESGKMNLIIDKYNFSEMLREEYTIFSFKSEEKQLALVFDIDTSIPSMLIGDVVRIKQIITNLLNNAIKYTDKGTVTLRIKLENCENNSALLHIEVEDTGRGIKSEDIEKLFMAFERVDERNNRNIEGTGLGLNIASLMLQLMNSELKVRSTFGEGSCFYFDLRQDIFNVAPIGKVNLTSEEEVVAEKTDLIYNPDLKILAVDDNMVNLKVFCGLLKKTGAQIFTATGGEQTLSLTADTRFDIIFLDHMMPVMDGIETFKRLRSQPGGKNLDTPVIILTANAIKGSYEEYINLGFNGVCYKPTTQQILSDTIKQWT